MNKIISLLLTLYIFNFNAQKDVVLRLNHFLNQSNFQYNQNFEVDGVLNNYTRLQYYLSGFQLYHDGGQMTLLNNTYVLASGHITNYYLGNFNVSQLESISFDVGVDQIANSGNTTNYPASHPLGPKSPPMDWGWPSGYFFVVTNGINDADNDNIPETPFQLHALGDQMLSPIDQIILNPIISNDTIYIDIKVNAGKFLSGINLSTAGIDHSSSTNNLIMCNNSFQMNVFEAFNGISSNNQSFSKKNYVYIDNTLSFAPTIYYHFEGSNKVSLKITDLNGKIHSEEKKLQNEGSYFPLKEFSSGIYIVTMYNGKEMIHTKFNVVQ